MPKLPPATVPVDTWAFLLADDPDAWRKDADESGWSTVRVPHDWSVGLDFDESCSSGTGYLPGGVGWYRAHVSLATLGLGATGRRVRLVFHGVQRGARVWVNGYHVGGRPSGYAEFAFDLTEICSYAPDDDLAISVRVDHTDVSDSRWYDGSGINRRVELRISDPIAVAPHGTEFATLDADADAATVRVRQTLENHTDATVTVGVQWELVAEASGRRHAFGTTVVLPARDARVAEGTHVIADPDLWSDAQAHLYRLVTTLTHAGGASTEQERVGVRTIAFDPDLGFFVNGEPRTLRGVCLHEDAGCFGTAVPREVWLRRLLRLREAGCNAIRMAHNPHDPDLYALCDELGLFVIDEAFDEWENPKNKWWQGHNVYPPRHGGPAAHFPEWHERDLTAMVAAHRHHPSIIAWSIGNEIDYPNDPYASPLFTEMVGNNDANKPASERVYDPDRPDIRRLTTIGNRLIELVRSADPTRPVTLAAAFPELSGVTGLFDRLDVIGSNYKEHLYPEQHARFPGQALLGSENSHGYAQWRTVIEHAYVAGQFLWTGVDYLGEAHGWPVHGSGAGLLTLAGFPKPGWHLRRSWWTDQLMAHAVARPVFATGVLGDEAERGWEREEFARTWRPGDRLEVLCFSNADAVCLTGAGPELALTWDAEHGWWSGVVTAGDEPLRIVAVRGDAVASTVLHPAGPPVALAAEVWSPSTEYAGVAVEDAVRQVEITVVDAAGQPAADDVLVTVSVEGGTLLGLENGDLADTTGYTRPHRGTHAGRLVAFVAGGPAAALRLEASGLPALLVDLPGQTPAG